MSDTQKTPAYPSQVVARLRDYSACHDGDVDEAANLIEHMHDLLSRVYARCGNQCPAEQRHVLSPALRDSIRDLLYRSGGN